MFSYRPSGGNYIVKLHEYALALVGLRHYVPAQRNPLVLSSDLDVIFGNLYSHDVMYTSLYPWLSYPFLFENSRIWPVTLRICASTQRAETFVHWQDRVSEVDCHED